MDTIAFSSDHGDRVVFANDGRKLWLQSLYGLLCGRGGEDTWPARVMGSTLLSTSRGRFEGNELELVDCSRSEDALRVHRRTARGGLDLQTAWSFCEETGALARRDTITNNGDEPVTLYRCLARIALQPNVYEVYAQSSRWTNENQGAWLPLHCGAVELSGERGRSTQGCTPFACIREADTQRGFALHVLPRGNWMIRAYACPPMHSRAYCVVEAGIADEELRYVLQPGAQFEAPELVLLPLLDGEPRWSASRLHQYALDRWFTPLRKEPPIVWNTWLDLNDHLDIERLRAHLHTIKEIGCEVLVIDAGWYGRGTDGRWYDQAGDWRERLDGSFYGKMAEFADEVRAAGLGFGLWMEPEHVGGQAPVRAEHPEWFPGTGERLDIEQPEAYAWLKSEIARLITTYQLAWLKIDFNVGFSYDERGKELHGYYDCWYRMLDELREEYPDAYYEGCSSGGMRNELEALKHFDMHFVSDSANPVDVIRMSEGAMLRLLPGRIGKWTVLRSVGRTIPARAAALADAPESVIVPHTSGWQHAPLAETVDVDFACLACMIGVWGFSGDLTSLSDPNRAKLAEHVGFYKEWRRFIADSVAYMLTPPRSIQDQTGWSVVQLRHGSDERSLVYAYRLQDVRGRDVYRLSGLDADRTYRIGVFPEREEVDVRERSGAELMSSGLEIELRAPGTARVYVVTPIG